MLSQVGPGDRGEMADVGLYEQRTVGGGVNGEDVDEVVPGLLGT